MIKHQFIMAVSFKFYKVEQKFYFSGSHIT